MTNNEKGENALAREIFSKLIASNFLTQDLKEKLLLKLPESFLEASLQCNKIIKIENGNK